MQKNTDKDQGREWFWCSDCRLRTDRSSDKELCKKCALHYEEQARKRKQ